MRINIIQNSDNYKTKQEVDLAVVLQQDVWYATAWQISFALAARKFTTVQSSVRYV